MAVVFLSVYKNQSIASKCYVLNSELVLVIILSAYSMCV